MDAQEVRKLWQECHAQKIGVVAKRHGLTHQALLGMFFEFRLLGNELDDPAPAEIARQTALFRAGWSEEQEKSRWMGARTAN